MLQTEFDKDMLDANFQEFPVQSKISHYAGNAKFSLNFFNRNLLEGK
jgi:hypothetical protein